MSMKKTLLLLTVLVVLISCFFGRTLVMANTEEPTVSVCRYYTDIEIQKGDTLWTIAEKYSENSGMSIQEYVGELKAMNQMKTDKIITGSSLTVVYFSDAPAK